MVGTLLRHRALPDGLHPRPEGVLGRGAGRHRQPRRRDAGRRAARRRSRRSAPATSATSPTSASSPAGPTRSPSAASTTPNLTLFGCNYQDVFAFLVLIAVLDLPAVGPARRARRRSRLTDAPCSDCFDRKKNPRAAWIGIALIAVGARRAAVRAGGDRHRVGAHHQPRDPVRAACRSGSTSSSASPGCSTSATSRSTRSAPTSTRCSRRRTSTCTCRSGSSCRSARRSPASSACCSARRR